MAKKSVGKNYIYNLAYEILTVLVPLVTTPYISRTLGVEGIGIYSYTCSNATYFALFAALGTTVYARREVAYYQDDTTKRSNVFWEILLLRIILTIVSLCLYIGYIFLTPYRTIGLIQGFYVITVIFDITWFFQGMEDFGAVVLKNTIVKLVNILFIFALVKDESDLFLYIFGLAFLPLLGNVITWSNVIKYICFPKFKELRPFRHLKGAISLFIPTIAAQVYLLLDKTMLGVFSDSSIENGYYEQAQKIIKICWTFVTTFSAVMSSRIAHIFAKKDKGKLYAYIRNSFSVIWFLATPISFGVAAIAGNMVPWFFGEGFEKVEELLLIFCWIVFPIGINSVTGSQYLVATKRQKAYTISILIGAIINFGLNLFLIPRYFSIGAAVASVGAELIIAFVQVIYLIYIVRELKVMDILGGAWHYWVSGVVMYCLVSFIAEYLKSTIISTIFLVFVGAIIYISMLLLMRDKLILQGIHIVGKHTIRKK